jgi:sigma-E factor negative regulatory protein RseA
MKQNMSKEQLSAWMDGEIAAAEAEASIGRACADPGARHTWGRYHLIRAALQNEAGPLGVDGVADAVHQRLIDEPTVLAPRRGVPRETIKRAVTGTAMAASVAALAIIGLQWGAVPESANPGPVADAVERGDYIRSVAATRWDTVSPEAEGDLNLYLVEHSEFMPASRMNGMMSYVRFVGYDSNK